MKLSSVQMAEDGWTAVSSETLWEGPHLALMEEEVRTPARPDSRRWTVVRRKAAVVMAPLTKEGKLVLVRQERIPVRATIWEFPGGQVDGDAVASDVALRELREETGYELSMNGRLLPLGHFFSSPGFTDERAFFFLASPVEPGTSGHAHDESEAIVDCREFSAREIAQMIARDEIVDANTLSLCAKLVARGVLKLDP